MPNIIFHIKNPDHKRMYIGEVKTSAPVILPAQTW